MTDHHALGVAAAPLDAAWQEARRAGRDDDAGARDPIDVREQRSFQRLVLGTALLHEVGAFDGFGNYYELILPYQFYYNSDGSHNYQTNPNKEPNPAVPAEVISVAVRWATR